MIGKNLHSNICTFFQHRIMVLSDGRLVEFDTPAALMADKNTYFYGLVESAANKGTTTNVM